MVWPTELIVVGLAVFVTVSSGDCTAVVLTVDGVELSVAPEGSVAVAVAVLETEPASRSACETEYVAVHVAVAPGAIDETPAGQLMADSAPEPVKTPSLTAAPVSVTLPVFVIRNE